MTGKDGKNANDLYEGVSMAVYIPMMIPDPRRHLRSANTTRNMAADNKKTNVTESRNAGAPKFLTCSAFVPDPPPAPNMVPIESFREHIRQASPWVPWFGISPVVISVVPWSQVLAVQGLIAKDECLIRPAHSGGNRARTAGEAVSGSTKTSSSRRFQIAT
jgi:hypothetical protein